jgi:hypothetical protein
MISCHGLNLVFCPNSRANGNKQGWTGMPLSRIKIVTEAVCGCIEDFATVDHILWNCSLYRAVRMQLLEEDLSLCVRDMLALDQSSNIRTTVFHFSCQSVFIYERSV